MFKYNTYILYHPQSLIVQKKKTFNNNFFSFNKKELICQVNSKFNTVKKLNYDLLSLNFLRKKNQFVIFKDQKIIFVFKVIDDVSKYTLIKNKLVNLFYRYKKYITLWGLGYNFEYLRNILIIKVGFSHKILLKLNSTIDVVIKKKKKKLILSGANLNMINKFIYILSNLKKISYYKKKGLYFYKHNIKLKEGKIRK